MKRLAGNITDFEQLIRGNYLYGDKTKYLWELIRPAGESCLLSSHADGTPSKCMPSEPHGEGDIAVELWKKLEPGEK